MGKLFFALVCEYFIKEKEHALGIDVNTKARSFCPVDIGKHCTPNGNTGNKAEIITNSNTSKNSNSIPKLDTNQWAKVTRKGITKEQKHNNKDMRNNTNSHKIF